MGFLANHQGFALVVCKKAKQWIKMHLYTSVKGNSGVMIRWEYWGLRVDFCLWVFVYSCMCLYNIMKPEFTLGHRFLLGKTASGWSQSSELDVGGQKAQTYTHLQKSFDVLFMMLSLFIIKRLYKAWAGWEFANFVLK